MLNIGSVPASTGTSVLYQKWLFQVIAILATGLALAFIGCDSDDTEDTEVTEDTLVEETVIDIDGRQVVVLEGRLNADKTLTAAYDYLLRGAVFVEGGATLTIEAGVKIYGEQATNGTLIIAQGSTIMAEGTASAPIVMSSDAFEGSRARG